MDLALTKSKFSGLEVVGLLYPTVCAPNNFPKETPKATLLPVWLPAYAADVQIMGYISH